MLNLFAYPCLRLQAIRLPTLISIPTLLCNVVTLQSTSIICLLLVRPPRRLAAALEPGQLLAAALTWSIKQIKRKTQTPPNIQVFCLFIVVLPGIALPQFASTLAALLSCCIAAYLRWFILEVHPCLKTNSNSLLAFVFDNFNFLKTLNFIFNFCVHLFYPNLSSFIYARFAVAAAILYCPCCPDSLLWRSNPTTK